MKRKFILDPVYKDYITICPEITRFIDNYIFQRLRFIKQLGVCFFIFPGANHTRLEHSLGVYFLCKKFIDSLKEKGVRISSEEEKAVFLASLFHDLGHGPFSHTLEKNILSLSHEKITLKLLSYFDIDREIKNIIYKIYSKVYEKEFLISLISSQTDIDRFDYLYRDSYYLGLPYGIIDLQKLIKEVEVVNNKLVWNKKAFYALENYLFARYQMYYLVYFHPKNLSLEVLLRKIVKRAKELILNGETNFPYYFVKTVKEEKVDDFIKLNDSTIVSFIYEKAFNCKDSILKDLCNRFINRYLFKVKEIDVSDILEIEKIKNSLKRKKLNPKYYLEIIKTHRQAYSYYIPNEKDLILINDNGNLVEISLYSPTDAIKSLTRKVEKYYLVYPPEIEK